MQDHLKAAVVAAVVAIGWGFITGCNDDNAAPGPFLDLVLAEQQPQASNDGVLVYAQWSGGNYLSMSVSGGSIVDGLYTDAGGGTGLCLDVSGVSSRSLQVLPSNGEATIWAYLYQLDAGPAVGRSGCLVTTTPIEETVKTVVHTSNTLTITDAAGPTDAKTDGASAGKPSGDAANDSRTIDAGPHDASGDAEGGKN